MFWPFGLVRSRAIACDLHRFGKPTSGTYGRDAIALRQRRSIRFPLSSYGSNPMKQPVLRTRTHNPNSLEMQLRPPSNSLALPIWRETILVRLFRRICGSFLLQCEGRSTNSLVFLGFRLISIWRHFARIRPLTSRDCENVANRNKKACFLSNAKNPTRCCGAISSFSTHRFCGRAEFRLGFVNDFDRMVGRKNDAHVMGVMSLGHLLG